MKSIQKQIIIFSGFIVFILFGYFAIGNFNSSQSGEVKIATNKGVEDSISQLGIETDTGKRLETIANSGTSWGMSPFGSGKPLTEEENEKKPVFKKPNIEWKTRTLSGITYVFGEGDPKSVHEKFETFQGWDQNGYIDSNTVRPKVEILLVQFLANPMLITVINKCGSLTMPGNTSSPLAMGLPGVLFTTDFSMEGIITINPGTGRKELNLEKWGLFELIFNQIRDYEYPNVTKKRVNFLADQCLSGNEIAGFDSLVEQYNTIQHSWYNGSSENRKEVCQFLELKECNPVSDQ
jgi:hypothetical protein